MEVGTLVFYQSRFDQDGEELLAGVITMIAGEQIEVQIHQPKLGVSTFDLVAEMGRSDALTQGAEV